MGGPDFVLLWPVFWPGLMVCGGGSCVLVQVDVGIGLIPDVIEQVRWQVSGMGPLTEEP